MANRTFGPSGMIALAAAGFVAAVIHTSAAGVPRSLSPQTPASSLPPDYFETRVRPILAATCYDCHTDDEKGGLRLDSREAVLKGGESGPAIVPGDPENSLLIQAVRQMPGKPKMPKGKAPKLTEADIAVLAEWIRAGAPWPAAAGGAAPGPTATAKDKPITAEQRAFWSFQPLHATAAPAVTRTDWPRTDIDRFVLAALERAGLSPAGTADKRTLIRRATLDLTGLPPAWEEVSAFEKDDSPDAFAKAVDRLLASPQYGEHWGRLWLDIARYGEDDYRSLDPMGRGYNPYPNAYLYRDWVIKAFNDDLPYDQFVKAQLAGDLMDEKVRVRMLPALGFLGLGPWFYDNGAVEITRADERNDRVDAVSRGFLGLTVACARCHDHKYDPIPTKDYYSMAGVFLNTKYAEYPLVPKSEVEAYTGQDKRIDKKKELLEEFLETESRQLAEALAFQSSKYMKAAWRVTGDPKEDLSRTVEKQKLDYELLDRWVRFLAKPPRFYPDLTKWQEMIKRGGTADEAATLADEFQARLVDVMFEQKTVKEENDIIKAKALPGTKKKERAKLPSDFVTNDDFCPGCGLELKSMSIEKTSLWSDVFERDMQDGVDPQQSPDKVKPALLAFRGWGLERQLSAERRAYITDLRTEIETLEKKLGPKYVFVHGVADVEKPQNLKVALRGSAYKTGDEAPRRFLSVLCPGEPAPFTSGSGRLELATAIVEQPIAMRVIVNRLWKGHFGTGLVDTPSNFGVTGERPTNPALLEYLAQLFIDRKLSIKALHREIMLSRVYQLRTEDIAANAEKDSGNRLYWRMNRQRMTAEQIRDSVLAVAGELDLKAGGPSAPLTPLAKRRTVYGKISRYKLDQYLQLFDFPAANISAEKRFTTNVPLQRLFFMNSDFMQQYAEVLATRVGDQPDARARITKAYRLIFGRDPVEAEIAAGLEYLATEPMKQYEERKIQRAKDEAKAKEGAAKGLPPEPPAKPEQADGMMMGVKPDAGTKEDKAKLLPPTPWGRYIKVLLSSSEFLFID
jgi:cytochrome c553